MHNFIETPICMGKERTAHPTQKPLKVLTHLIKIFTNPNDIILDFFAGSGTTCIAASSLGRRSICIENNKTYFEIMKNRIKNEFSTLFNTNDSLKIIETSEEIESFFKENINA
jgi:DNA modification methylase